MCPLLQWLSGKLIHPSSSSTIYLAGVVRSMDILMNVDYVILSPRPLNATQKKGSLNLSPSCAFERAGGPSVKTGSLVDLLQDY